MTEPHPIRSPRKLIEVALPLDAINEQSARVKRKAPGGYPTTLHNWWAQRPLAAVRAVIFAQLVNDPGFQQGGGFRYGRNKKEAAAERRRLFKIIEELVKWENSTNEEVLAAAREEIRRSWREVCELNRDHPQAGELFNEARLPGLHDPFAGGGSIPLEAQRLGLDASAADLNPVAVLINKALVDVPPRFRDCPPVNPDARAGSALRAFRRADGLAEDVRFYGEWMRQQAETRLGELYPQIEVTKAQGDARPDLQGLVGRRLTVVAWLWARTVKSPNPAFSQVDVPLVSSYVLSSKEDKACWLSPEVSARGYHFDIRRGKPPGTAQLGTKASSRGSDFRCIMSGAAISSEYIRAEGLAGRIGTRLLATVVDGPRGRLYLAPDKTAEEAARKAVPSWRPDVEFMQQALGFRVGNYGMSRWSDLFTPRQLVALGTFSDLVIEARSEVEAHAKASGLADDRQPLALGGTGASAYADAVALYLAFACSRVADYGSALATWRPKDNAMRASLGKQTLSMVWDFAEGNPLGKSSSGLLEAVRVVAKTLEYLPADQQPGVAVQADAQTSRCAVDRFVATDPPYYDNIGYADLSDFFYVWLRRSLRDVFPELFTTVAVPKAEELVATPHRHGSRSLAEEFFLNGMTAAMRQLADQAHPAAPVTIFYAFKQSETSSDTGTSSTGWETFLDAIVRSGFSISGTWPVRTEGDNRQRGNNSNALASSIVLVCRKRPANALTISRREFLRELNAVLPEALDEMTKGSGDERSPVAPVDLSQAIVGPGMGVFSRYSAVLEADGSPMSVKTALQLINRFLAEDDFDHDTQFCLHWFDQHGWGEGGYGEADVLARAKSTSVSGLADAGVLKSGGGKVRLFRPSDYPSDWEPKRDSRIPIWEALHQLIRSLREQGESGAGRLLAAVKSKSEAIRQLAYRLYTLCERRGWADDARAYNELVTSWSGVESAAGELPQPNEQLKLFGGKE